MEKVAIVGAGICGLTLASLCSADLKSTLLIEKSKGVGGRLATRRDGDATFDHGAAFYVDSDQDSLVWHQSWLGNKKSVLWFQEEKRKYFCGAQGMTTLAKDLLEGKNIQLNEKVLKLRKVQNSIEIYCESGKVIPTQKVVLTCPLPQTLQILSESKINFPEPLKEISYSPAVVGLFELEANKGLYNFNLLRPTGAIFTIANNQAKGISKNLALTVVMNDLWSQKNFDLEDSVLLQKVETELADYFKNSCKVQKAQIKKWRYSQPRATYPKAFVELEAGLIYLAGDTFGGGSIAGAVRSAKAVFNSL